MRAQIERWLADLKALKISTSTIEKDLKFSNGLLGKAAKGKTRLSEQKYDDLESYWSIKTGRSTLLKGSMTDPNSEAGEYAIRVVEDIKEKYKEGGSYDQISAMNFIPEPQPKWVKEIEEYCKLSEITPQELIIFHKSKGSTKLNIAEMVKANTEKQLRMSKYDEERRLKKNGF